MNSNRKQQVLNVYQRMDKSQGTAVMENAPKCQGYGRI